MENLLTVVLSRQRSPTPEGRAIEKALLQGLDRWPELPVLVLPHLYDLLPNGMGFQALREIRGDMVVLSWLYPRAAFWVLQANGVQGQMGRTPLVPEEEMEPAPAETRAAPQGAVHVSPNPAAPETAPADRTEPTSLASAQPTDQPNPAQAPETPSTRRDQNMRTIWCLDLRTPGTLEAYLDEIGRLVQLTGATKVSRDEALGPPTRLGPFTMQEITELLQARWYPVIDRSRCRNCQECLNFCLFGVYGLDAQGRVYVEMPDMCRPGCPACARVCPSGAIMFPHYSDPAIAGAPGQPRSSAPGGHLADPTHKVAPGVSGSTSISVHPSPPGAGSQTPGSAQGADPSGPATETSGPNQPAAFQLSASPLGASAQGADASGQGAATPPTADQPRNGLDRLVDQLDQMDT